MTIEKSPGNVAFKVFFSCYASLILYRILLAEVFFEFISEFFMRSTVVSFRISVKVSPTIPLGYYSGWKCLSGFVLGLLDYSRVPFEISEHCTWNSNQSFFQKFSRIIQRSFCRNSGSSSRVPCGICPRTFTTNFLLTRLQV